MNRTDILIFIKSCYQKVKFCKFHEMCYFNTVRLYDKPNIAFHTLKLTRKSDCHMDKVERSKEAAYKVCSHHLQYLFSLVSMTFL